MNATLWGTRGSLASQARILYVTEEIRLVYLLKGRKAPFWCWMPEQESAFWEEVCLQALTAFTS